MIHELRREHELAMLLEIAQLPRSTFYYHSKRQGQENKYAHAKAEIAAIYHENKGRYGYQGKTKGLAACIAQTASPLGWLNNLC